MMRALEMCFDRRVLVALAAIALAFWVLAPQLLLAALPVLVLLACPLSMLLMAWMMRGEMRGTHGATAGADRLAALEREQTRLATEIARRRAEIEAGREPADQHTRRDARRS